MSEVLPSITLITTTYYPNTLLGHRRSMVAEQAVETWKTHLKHSSSIVLHVADDGSEIDHSLQWPVMVTRSRQERGGIGASLNAGFAQALKQTPISMYLVDDWILNADIDLVPWVKLLMEDRDVGMVRIGPPHPGIVGRVENYPYGWAMVLEKHHFAFAMRPALFHTRFFEAYGMFHEGISVWECERLYNEHFCSTAGPDIVYALPTSWHHEDILPLGEIEP